MTYWILPSLVGLLTIIWIMLWYKWIDSRKCKLLFRRCRYRLNNQLCVTVRRFFEFIEWRWRGRWEQILCTTHLIFRSFSNSFCGESSATYIFKVVITACNAGAGYISRWIVEMIIIVFMMIVRAVDGCCSRWQVIVLIVLPWTRWAAICCTYGAGRRWKRTLFVVFWYRNF